MTAASGLARAWRGPPGLVLRVLLTVVPLVWLSRTLRVADVLAGLSHVGATALVVALACFQVAVLGGIVRWRVLLRAYGAPTLPTFLEQCRHGYVGLYFSLVTGVLGDVVRGYRIGAHLPDLTTSYTVLLAERVVGLLGLLAIAGAAWALGDQASPVDVTVAFVVSLAVAVLLTVAGLGVPRVLAARPAWRARVEKLPLVGASLARMPAPRAAGGVVVALLLSLVTQAMVVLGMGVLVRAVAPSVGWGAAARALPAVILLTGIPITPAAVGQREAVFVYALGLVGVAPAAAVAASIATFACTLAHSLVGGVLYLEERRHDRRRR